MAPYYGDHRIRKRLVITQIIERCELCDNSVVMFDGDDIYHCKLLDRPVEPEGINPRCPLPDAPAEGEELYLKLLEWRKE